VLQHLLWSSSSLATDRSDTRCVRVVELDDSVETDNRTFVWAGTIRQRRAGNGSTVVRSFFGNGFVKGTERFRDARPPRLGAGGGGGRWGNGAAQLPGGGARGLKSASWWGAVSSPMTVLLDRPGMWRCEHTDDGIFFVHVQNAVVNRELLDEFLALVQPLVEERAPVLYMNDAADVQDFPLPLQWQLAQRMKRNAPLIKRSGVFGLTPGKAFIVRSLARAAGRRNVRTFETRPECERWLLAGD
jgi:hypothetical protein